LIVITTTSDSRVRERGEGRWGHDGLSYRPQK